MYIQSKLVEAGKTVCDLLLKDQYVQNEPVLTEEQEDAMGEHVVVQSSMLHASGFLLLKTHFLIKEKVTDRFLVKGDHIQLSFFLNGKSRMHESRQKLACDLDIGIMRRNYFQRYERSFDMRGGNEVNYIALYLSVDFFTQLVAHEAWAKHDAFIQDILNGTAHTAPDQTCAISLPILQVLQELLRNNFQGIHRRYFTELKLKELLFLSHVQHTRIGHDKVRDDELYDTLEKIKAYLVAHFDNPPTIKQLSRMFSRNELKLKQGFKAQYGTTIYAFVIQLRMQKAEKMLHENYSVSEMSTQLGYLSVSHFISTYKKHFGHTPKQAIKKVSQSTSLLFVFCSSWLDCLY
ncbi:AraC family transcriptional regulator [Olivibacter sp. XZL3]|uniref:helix-turn-helix transcriptional regulator n=1 Tax=Olivibacter sp. XZL3 TaxID=1735116 RepID=UPI0010666312|nr:AraC family transcriptional regulator [Olivibacter sp. XZL3]